MKFITLIATLVAAVPAVLAQLTINTPPNVPTQLTWSGGQAPYYLSLVPGGQPTATPIEQFPNQNGTSYTWMVDLQAGTTFNIALKDSTGLTAYSDIITVQAGSSTSCVNTSIQGGSPTSGGTAASATSGSGTSAGSSSARLLAPRRPAPATVLAVSASRSPSVSCRLIRSTPFVWILVLLRTR
ncbi:hypothetical protein EDC04DRAFT_2874336 [Pisolithus marmoratus]|nr:hypothetical protein EDC04DRAFT_2874336 [Pisolithus marmoratus]